MKRHSQSGIALVVTLVMLAVITVLAVAFLGVSRRERALVVERGQQTLSSMMADTALERAKAEIAATMLVQYNQATNAGFSPSFLPLGPELFVSTTPTQNVANKIYHYEDPQDGIADARDVDIIATNLLYDPRPPVFIDTNQPGGPRGPRDFRFYVDLDRNGTYTTNGIWWPVDGRDEKLVGDPEWIGVLQRPNASHYTNNLQAANNQFVGRYAYLVLPAGRTLDLNFIHNRGKDAQTDYFREGFNRNQGVGSWEINLAAFLTDLNTNIWGPRLGLNVGYSYTTNLFNPSQGNSFVDAYDILRLRYEPFRAPFSFPLRPRLTVTNLFRGDLYTNFWFDGIDAYANSAPTPLGASIAVADDRDDHVSYPWPGAPNRTNLHSVHEYFGPSKSGMFPGFRDRLRQAVASTDPYDKYTFYRMLKQLGTDTEPDRPLILSRWVSRMIPQGGSVTAIVTNHCYYSGDDVTFYYTNSGYQGTFRITVVNSNEFTFSLDSAQRGTTDLPDPRWANVRGELYCVDPFAFAKINLNYDNISSVRVNSAALRNPKSYSYGATNLQPWKPQHFFTAVADRLLRREMGMFLNNLPVYTNNSSLFIDYKNRPNPTSMPLYSPRVHQLLQIACNLCDSGRGSKTNEAYPYYPTVLRPQFEFRDEPTTNGSSMRRSLNVYITNYVEVGTEFRDQVFSGVPSQRQKWFDLDGFDSRRAAELAHPTANFYGIPFIIGAKKGFPNFNQAVFQDQAKLTKKYLYRKNVVRAGEPTNPIVMQKLEISVTNAFAIEAWNSYTSSYPRALEMYCEASLNVGVTNSSGLRAVFGRAALRSTNLFPMGSWRSNEFKLLNPIQIVDTLPISQYQFASRTFARGTNVWEPVVVDTNAWTLEVTNRLAYFLFDRDQYNQVRLVDMVSLSVVHQPLTLSSNASPGFDSIAAYWDARPLQPGSAVTHGHRRTYGVWKGEQSDPANWRDSALARSSTLGFAGFQRFMNPLEDPPYAYPTFQIHAPDFAVVRTTSLEVNDPLVHYTILDYDPVTNYASRALTSASNLVNLPDNLGGPNLKYAPWGNGAVNHWALKDPFAFMQAGTYTGSDNWRFNENKYPSVGWIGRVHRGTPWQTIYLKSANVDMASWLVPSGPGATADTHPTNDWRLVDLFTTSLHPNAERGRLSINQSVNQAGLAAWSAVLSGASVTRTRDDGSGESRTEDVLVQPGSQATQPDDDNLRKIVRGINAARDALPAPRQFTNVCQLLSVPQLTDASPFLVPPYGSLNADGKKLTQENILTDSDYERIPEQILSLVKVGEPRFVIYAFGQSLRPAENSVETGNRYLGLVKNYQITGETVSRAVVRFEPVYNATNGLPDWSRPPRAIVESFNALPQE